MVNIVILHPDLGLGGAERLIVDVAVALQEQGHHVEMVTSHHDPSHCFDETIDGTVKVRVYGDWLPIHVCGRMHLVCAILRSTWAAMRIACAYMLGQLPMDCVFIDQISTSVPLFSMGLGVRVMFYCHYPDQLLTQRTSWLKRLYRVPLDLLEELTTGCAHLTLINSQFTGRTFARTFRLLTACGSRPQVLYPTVRDTVRPQQQQQQQQQRRRRAYRSCMFVSINRYERKKNINLAIEAFATLVHTMMADDDSKRRDLQLVVAGGYDERVRENTEHYAELRELALRASLSVSLYPDCDGDVVFVRSFDSKCLQQLLDECLAVLYTPANEHFGIVPLEAMSGGCPVIAVNSGGPTETVLHEHTGYLCEPTTHAFATAMRKLAAAPALAQRMGEQGRVHVRERFSRHAFATTLNQHIVTMMQTPARGPWFWLLSIAVVGVFVFFYS